ncbi:MAG: SDR family NAD(P)-dependent oxidoreductase, partial [Actinoallomurus sp.]
EPLVASTLTAKRPDVHALTHTLARLHTTGVDVDWRGWFPSEPPAQVVELPTYAFQQEHFWLSGGVTADAAGLGLVSAGHPLLGAAVELAGRGTRVLTGRLSRQAGSWLDEHAVAGTVLLPGSALVEWALRAADEVGCAGVEELTLQEPLTLPESGGLRVQVVVDAAAPDGRRTLQVYSRPDEDSGGPDEWVCHADGTLGPEPGAAPERLDGPWPPAGAEPVDVAGFYERAAVAGYDYGPVFQGLQAVWRDGANLLAEVTLPEAAGEPGGFGVHPALLDAALHPLFLAGLSGTEPGEGPLSLPFAWTGVRLWATGATTIRVRLSPASGSGENGLRVTVADPAGAPVLGVDSLVVRPVSAERLRGTRQRAVRGLFAVGWTPLPVPATFAGWPGAPDDGDWVALGPYEPAGAPAHYAGLDVLTKALDDGAPVPSIALSEPGIAGGGDADLAGAGRAAAEQVLELVRGWLAEPRLAGSRLVVVTRGAVATGHDEDAGGDAAPQVDPAAAGVWGLVRTAQSENPGRFLLLDLDLATAASEVDPMTAVRAALAADEPQVAIRGTHVLVPRLEHAGAPAELVLPAGEPAWRLGVGRAGTLESVSAVPCPEVLEPLGPGRVRVSVRSAGINFRDVLIALGMYPGGGVFGGSEGAGVVTGVGPGVTSVSVGDHVVGLFEGAFGPLAVADARMVVPVPEGWSFQQAAAVPVAFLTAWYGLVDLAGLRAGQSVLIHAATGGVGMAAVQVARHRGAEVYATASPAKHALLAEMGIDEAHRASSRDLDFEAAVREATGGRGVDVVLNSLAGEFVDASLRLLADGGRFVEMGKTDIREPERVGREFPGVSYRAFDLVGDAGADRVGEMLGTLAELFAAGALRPLRVRAWPLARVRQALRTMSQARHTGKLVLDIPPTVDPDGTTLITGGTGTLGALVAEHLVRTGQTGRLLLVGRRGGDAPGAAELVARLEDLGAQVRIAAADVSDPAAVTGLIAAIDPAHPLTGVIHAAGVIDDAMIASQSPERLARVWATKATAAVNLHTATAALPLGMFVVFSSAAGTLGSPGQANYAAANAFCDALAAHRRHLGLPGLSVGWGLWAAASAMTGQLTKTDVARMSRTGFTPLGSRHGLALLDAAGRHGAAHLVAVDLDPRALTAGTAPAVLRALAAGGPARPAAGTTPERADLAGRLAVLSRAEQRDALLGLVRDEAAAVLGHADSGVIHSGTTFKELGFDSLTVVELRNRLAAATGLRLAASLVFDYPEAVLLADHLHRRLSLDDAAPPAEDAVDPILAELGRIEGTLTALPLDEAARGRVARRLNGLLSALSGGPAAPAGFDGVESASDDEMFELIDREL